MSSETINCDRPLHSGIREPVKLTAELDIINKH